MLLDCGDFGVDGRDAGAGGGSTTHGSRVTLEGAVDQRGDLTIDIACSLSVRKCLISSCLLKTGCVLDKKG